MSENEVIMDDLYIVAWLIQNNMRYKTIKQGDRVVFVFNNPQVKDLVGKFPSTEAGQYARQFKATKRIMYQAKKKLFPSKTF